MVYAALGAGAEEAKRQRALDLIESEDFGTSAQVLQEFFVTVVKKAARPLSAGGSIGVDRTVGRISLLGNRPETGADRD